MKDGFFTLGEWIDANKPFRLTDGFATYIYNDNAVSAGIHCIPHYVANQYSFTYSHIPIYEGSIFDLLRKFEYYNIRTLCDIVGYEFTYPFLPKHLKNFNEYIWGFDGEWLNDTLAKETYIYLIKDQDTGLVKIGYSYNPSKRLRDLMKQETLLPRPHNFYLLSYWRDSPLTEKVLHSEFALKRVRGEWFDLSDGDLRELELFKRIREKRIGFVEDEFPRNDCEEG